MANKVITVGEILTDLNRGLVDKPWISVDGVYQLSQTQVNSSNLQITPTGTVMVVKIFLNIKTTEVRSYVAKWTNAPETETLP
jgi:ribosome recycling factor